MQWQTADVGLWSAERVDVESDPESAEMTNYELERTGALTGALEGLRAQVVGTTAGVEAHLKHSGGL